MHNTEETQWIWKSKYYIIEYHKSKIGMKQNPEYQYIYQYNPKIGLLCSTFRSIFAISVQEVHISTSGHPVTCGQYSGGLYFSEYSLKADSIDPHASIKEI